MCVCAVDEWCSVRVCECACAWPPSWFSLWFHCTSVSNASGFARIMYHLDLNTLHIHSQNTLDILYLSLYLSLYFFPLFCLGLFVSNVVRKPLLIATILLTSEYEKWKNATQIMMYGLFGFRFLLYFCIFIILVTKKHEWVSVKNAFKSIIPGWKVWVFSKWHRNFKIKTKKSHRFYFWMQNWYSKYVQFFLVCIRLKWTSQTMQNNLYTCHGRPTSSWYWSERLRSTSRNYVFCLLVLKA